MDSLSRNLTVNAQIMLNTCECMEKLKKDEIKVTVIFFEKTTQDSKQWYNKSYDY